MRHRLFLFILLSAANLVFAQIENPGFEFRRDTLPLMPAHWNPKTVRGFVSYVDTNTSYAGRNSLFLKSVESIDSNRFIPFSQFVKMNVAGFKRIAVTVYVKTKGVTGNVGVWCQVRDENKQMIGFQNLEIQNQMIKGDNDWTKHSLVLNISPKCKTLIPGGYLQGNGSAWFDNFSIEEVPFTGTPPSKEVKRYLDHFCGIIKKYSIYSDKIDWNALDNEVSAMSTGINQVRDAGAVTGYVMDELRSVGDNHSLMMSRHAAESSKVANLDERSPSGKVIEGGIGYVYVPGFVSTSKIVGEKFAEQIQGIIRKIDSENTVKGWIVDLRENTGGNMYPMITGLGPLTGEGTLGYFQSPKGKTAKWYYKRGSTGLIRLKDYYTVKNPDAKIAVLIGPETSSAGEATAISFIGNPNAKLFGQSTGGYTTGNYGFKLKDGSYLALAVSYEMDRTKKKYLGKINPDVFVEREGDVVGEAVKWLLE